MPAQQATDRRFLQDGAAGFNRLVAKDDKSREPACREGLAAALDGPRAPDRTCGGIPWAGACLHANKFDTARRFGICLFPRHEMVAFMQQSGCIIRKLLVHRNSLLMRQLES